MSYDQYLKENAERLVREAEELDRLYREADDVKLHDFGARGPGEADDLDELNRGYAQDRISRSRL